MSKVDTDQGLGPGSERARREVREAQEKLESGAKQKAAAPAEDAAVDKNAVTQPGVGKVDRKSDTVDDLLDGFGTSRPDLPRILPKADTTPPPEPVRKELTPTEPGKRQRIRNTILVTSLSFAVVIAIGIGLVKLGQSTAQTAPLPTQTATATTPTNTTQPTTAATTTETISPITTMAVDSLPTVKTAATAPVLSTARTVHSATTATAPTTATTTAAHPTGSAPPGLNLFPDDPHR